MIDSAPDGSLFAEGSEAERFMTGPVVDRWLLELDLDTEIARIAAIREAAGPDVVIVADPNIGWTAQEAIEVLPILG